MNEWAFSNREIDTRLVSRFQLADYPGVVNPYALFRHIYPVTSIDTLLKTPKLDSHTADISGAVAPETYFTVPDGKRWTLVMARREATTGTSYISISDGTTVILLTESSSSAGRAVIDQPITLDEGWTIRMQKTNNGADSSIDLNICYEEEDAF